MTPEAARDAIRAKIQVTPSLIAQAKQMILTSGGGRSDALVRDFERSIAVLPQPVVVHPTVDMEGMIRDAAAALSARLAAVEAVAMLMAEGLVVMASAGHQEISFSVQYTTVVPGSSGESSAWRFDELRYCVPAEIAISPSYRFGGSLMLGDADVFLRSLDVADMDPLVQEALREAVSCFRRDLFTPSLVMLAKAIEGAWTELGLALADALDSLDPRSAGRLRSDLRNERFSLAKRIDDVASMYRRRDLLKEVESEVSCAELDRVVTWSHQVRRSRNVVHFGVAATVPNSFESVSVLMLAAVDHLRTLYRARAAAVAVAARARVEAAQPPETGRDTMTPASPIRDGGEHPAGL